MNIIEYLNTKNVSISVELISSSRFDYTTNVFTKASDSLVITAFDTNEPELSPIENTLTLKQDREDLKPLITYLSKTIELDFITPELEIHTDIISTLREWFGSGNTMTLYGTISEPIDLDPLEFDFDIAADFLNKAVAK